MARAKKTAAASPSTAPKRRGIDVQEVEARVEALDKAKRRSYDIYEIEQRVYNLEKKGSSPTPTAPVYTLELGEAITGASVTLVKDKCYLFTTVYNTGYFTNADICLGKGGSVYVADQIGRMICGIIATNTSVSFSGYGDVAPNKYIPLKKDGEAINGFAWGKASFASGTSITATAGELYVVATSDLSETFTGAEVIGSFLMGIEAAEAGDTKVYVIKATDTTISYGGKTIYYNRLVGGDLFA